MANPTIVVITDRNDLDGQLFGVFCLSQDLLRERYGLTADGIYNSVKALFGASVATDDAARLASLVGSLPHGDEQGS